MNQWLFSFSKDIGHHNTTRIAVGSCGPLTEKLFVKLLNYKLDCCVVGFAAGQHYTQPGGSSEYICLPLDPEYNEYTTTDSGTWIYGAEYESKDAIFPSFMQNQNVPCAKCYLPSRSTNVMIPAKRTCPNEWNKVLYYISFNLLLYSGSATQYFNFSKETLAEIVIVKLKQFC